MKPKARPKCTLIMKPLIISCGWELRGACRSGSEVKTSIKPCRSRSIYIYKDVCTYPDHHQQIRSKHGMETQQKRKKNKKKKKKALLRSPANLARSMDKDQQTCITSAYIYR